MYRSYLQTNGEPPKILWINLGRATSEKEIKNFSSFAKDLVDGMIDHNFGNSGTGRTLMILSNFKKRKFLSFYLTVKLGKKTKGLLVDRTH